MTDPMMTNEDAIAVSVAGSQGQDWPASEAEKVEIVPLAGTHLANLDRMATTANIASALERAERRGEERMREALKIAVKALCHYRIDLADHEAQIALTRIAELVPEMGE